MAFQAVRGFKDIIYPESVLWDLLEERSREIALSFGFEGIRIPVLENTEVFTRGIGQHTDIVEKEMYTFLDKNNESISLRPEATAGVIRAAIENKLFARKPVQKLFTIGQMFRHERPQKGRLRQFHQINAEILGTASPISDAEIIALAMTILMEFLDNDKFQNLRLEINSLGCPQCRPSHRADLSVYLSNNIENLCDDCKRRSETNSLRVFDCKKEGCKKVMLRAPLIKHYLCPECAEHLGNVFDFLECHGIKFVQNPSLVRGLDYYTKTTFEIVSTSIGAAQSTIAAGGRYDGLISQMGGPDVSGVGMAIGIERLMLMLSQHEEMPENKDFMFFVPLGQESVEFLLPLSKKLREEGYNVKFSFDFKSSLKSQLKNADREKARLVFIMGENEVNNKEIVIKDMQNHTQENVSFDNFLQRIRDLAENYNEEY